MRPEIPVVYDALQYDADSGLVRWKSDQTVAGWDNGNGYRRIEIAGQRVYAHQVAWLFLYGEWPSKEVDHIDGNPANNAKANLRLADRFQNNRNSRTRSHSKSGLKGVRFETKRGKWSARITADNKVVFLGRFPDADSAHQAYCAAAERLHGEFARFA